MSDGDEVAAGTALAGHRRPGHERRKVPAPDQAVRAGHPGA
jgi:hypothetical protein